MPVFEWDEEKNIKLQNDRGISFEKVIVSIEAGKILDIAVHPNIHKYPGQQIIVVEIENYAYCVPVMKSKESIFLKTIYPSRKATKKFLNNKNNDQK